MFLAHFSNTSIVVLDEMDAREVSYWHGQAVKVHNKLNAPPNG